MNRKGIVKNVLSKELNLIIFAYTFGVVFFLITGGTPLTGFTRALGTGDLMYSIMMAMPIIGSILQVFASYFLENTGKRKFIYIFFGLINKLLWIVIAIIPLVVPSDKSSLRIWSVAILIIISSSANSIVSVVFSSWISVIVPIQTRGSFFSKRMLISTITGAVSGIVAGKLLDSIPDFKGFAIIFIFAATMGIIDIICFIWIKDPPMELPKEKISFLKLFFEPYSNKNYVRFMILISAISFAGNLAGPFYNVYLLEYLKIKYFTITLITQVTSSIFIVIFVSYWGKVIDKLGNMSVMALCGSISAVLPIIWCFSTPNNYTAILIYQIIGGIIWPSVELSTVNLSIWLAPEKNRSIYVANYTLLTTVVGAVIAFVCGGALMQYTTPLLKKLDIPFVMGQTLNSFHILIIVSSILRLLSIVFLLPRIKEENSRSTTETIAEIKKILRINKF